MLSVFSCFLACFSELKLSARAKAYSSNCTVWKLLWESYNKNIIAFPGLGNMGRHSVLGFCIVPRCARANTASLELNTSPYCPPCHAIIYISDIPPLNAYATIYPKINISVRKSSACNPAIQGIPVEANTAFIMNLVPRALHQHYLL